MYDNTSGATRKIYIRIEGYVIKSVILYSSAHVVWEIIKTLTALNGYGICKIPVIICEIHDSGDISENVLNQSNWSF